MFLAPATVLMERATTRLWWVLLLHVVVCVGGLDGESDITEGVLGSTGRGICMLGTINILTHTSLPFAFPPPSPLMPHACCTTCFAAS